jgi:hypothetical protein
VAQQDLLVHTVRTLNELGVEYLITGSIVTSLQGEPRSTHDIDVVVQVSVADVPRLLDAFPRPRFYVEESTIREAIRLSGTFNIIDTEEGDKVDFWMFQEEPFDRSRFQRKYRENVFGVEMSVSSPEDTILAKLRWAKMSGGSERHVRDVLGVYEVQALNLDQAYLDEWATTLGVTDLLNAIRQQASRDGL